MLNVRKFFVNDHHRNFSVGNIADMDIGRALASMLRERKLSAAAVAKRSGLSTASLSKYKGGKASPSLAALGLIASAIGVRPSEIIARAEAPEGVMLPEVDHLPYPDEQQMQDALAALSGRKRRALLDFIQAMEGEP
ncbi:MAG: helix-turn-helix transcriptional regulator [Rhodocyclaceae bacterium]|nr:helix-turn-helix transcriptional regulator [Rhodocyclaceae bacterium]